MSLGCKYVFENDLHNVDVVDEDEEGEDHDDAVPQQDGALAVGRVEGGLGSSLVQFKERVKVFVGSHLRRRLVNETIGLI